MAKKITGYIKLQVPAGKANPSPPIGPALGQRGLNIMQFVKEFNAATQGMEPGMPVPVVITAFADRTFTFVTKTPPVSYFLKKAAGVEKGSATTGRSQAGLFDVALHPDYARNQLVYLSLSKPFERGTGTAAVRGRLVENDENARLEEVETVFEMNEADQDSSGLHFGGRMAFHPEDRSLFLTIGERRNISRAQDPEDQAGSIVRVTDEGGVPEDNPFVGAEGRDPKIYSWGHRNPQGLAFRPGTGELWSNEHGPRGGDELNLIEAGNNYGWPYLTSGTDYSGAPVGVGTEKEGMTSAVHHFEETLAPSGLAFYSGDLFPEWEGHMLNGALQGRALVRVVLDGREVVGEEWMLRDLDRRIRDVEVAEDGSIWLLTDHEDGEVLRLAPAEASGETAQDG